MNGAPIIEIIVSLIFVYFMLSIAVNGIVEVLNKWDGKRGKLLRYALNKVLNDPKGKNWASLLYNHPLIGALKKTYKSLPSYISSNLFSSVIIDLIINEGKEFKINHDNDANIKYEEKPDVSDALDKFKKGVEKLNQSDVRQYLQSFLIDADDIIKLKANIGQWYDDYMDRISGWFKWDMKKLSLYVAISITLVFNINSLEIIDTISKDDAIRQRMTLGANMAVNNLAEATNDTAIKNDIKNIQIQIDTLSAFFLEYNLPFGWPSVDEIGLDKDKDIKLLSYFSYIANIPRIIGWLITILAITLGAPFWFNVLNNLVNMRNAGIKPERTKEKEQTT